VNKRRLTLTEQTPYPEDTREPREAPSETQDEPEAIIAPSTQTAEGVEIPLKEKKRFWWRRMLGV
jgi:hypothetical protein